MIAWKVDPRRKDLVFEGGSPVLIEGVQKLEQDVRWAIIEPLGNDGYNPNWGSRIPFMIGEAWDPSTLKYEVEAEVLETLRKYHEQILDRIEEFRFTGVPGQFKLALMYASGELIRDVGETVIRMVAQDKRSAEFEIELWTERGERVVVLGSTQFQQGEPSTVTNPGVL